MALANIAWLLYNKGHKVMMIDWDLEAPGLERFFYKKSETIERIKKKPGLMDMLLDYKFNISKELHINRKKDLPYLKPKKIAFKIFSDPGGAELRLLTAGRRSKEYYSKYVNSVNSFDWIDFYKNWDGELYFEWLREQLELSMDIVLIDSRTGVNEIGGVSVSQLADVVVMFCAPNEQNLEGTKKLANKFSKSGFLNLRQKQNRKVNLIIVPSRVENAEIDQLTEFQSDFAESFSRFVPYELKIGNVPAGLFDRISVDKIKPEIAPFWKLMIPYTPYYSFKERLAVSATEIASKPLTDAYTILAKDILKFYPRKEELESISDISWLESISDISWGNIKSKSSTINEYRSTAEDLIKNAEDSIYLTCIYPPEFWIIGNYLFNWDKLGTKYDYGERLKNHFRYLIPFDTFDDNELQDIEFKKENKYKINAEISNCQIFSIELKENFALLNSKYLRKGLEDVKLITRRKSDDDPLYIYSGNYKSNDLDSYKKFCDLISDKTGLERIRIFITDIYGDDLDWKRDATIVNQFIRDYNKNIKLRICSARDPSVAQFYLGDMMIIDKKIVLMYDPNKAEPNGERRGRIQLITGDIVKRYLEIFQIGNELKEPKDYWGEMLDSDNAGHND